MTRMVDPVFVWNDFDFKPGEVVPVSGDPRQAIIFRYDEWFHRRELFRARMRQMARALELVVWEWPRRA